MSWISWPTTPATEDALIEKVWTFFQKLSVPSGILTQVRAQFFHPTMEKLTHNLTAQLTLKFPGNFRVGTAPSKDHAHHGVIQPSCRSGVRACERKLRIVHASSCNSLD